MVLETTEYYAAISAKAAEIKTQIRNGNITADPNWDLEQNFESYFAPYYITVLSFNGILSTVLHLLVWYVLLTKTPKEMKDYRLFLMNISVCSFIHDIQLSSFWRPVPLFPSTGGFVQGTARVFGPYSGQIGFVMCIFLIATYISSMVIGFVYRMVALMDRWYYDIMMSWYGLTFLGIAQFFAGFTLCPLLVIATCPYDVVRNKTLAKFPQLEPIFDSEYAFGYDLDYNPFLIYFFILTLFFIFIILPAIEISCICILAYQLKKVKGSLSERTYKLHKNLLIALSVQIMLPNVMILLPDVFIIFGAWKGWPYINLLAEITLMSCSIHSVLDNLVMLVAVTPYRHAVKRMILRKPEAVTVVTITSHVSKS